MVTNVTDVLTCHWCTNLIYNCLVSENDKQLQQGHSPNFYWVGGKHIPPEKILEIQYWGGEFLQVDEMVIKQIFKERLSFFILLWQWAIHINYYKEHFWALIF